MNNDSIINEKLIFLDNGYNYGYGLFETILILQKPVFLSQHLNRLNQGLKKLNINKQIPNQEVVNYIEKNNYLNCVLKICVSENNKIFTTRPIPYKQEQYKQGFSIKVSNLKRNPYSHAVYLKSLNYLDNIVENKLAKAEGFDEVIFFNVYNHLAEGSVSNIFFMKNNIIHTPSINCGILNGVVREWIINNYQVNQGEYIYNDLIKSDGVFITNSIMGIMKVTNLNNINIPFNKLCDNIYKDYTNYIKFNY